MSEWPYTQLESDLTGLVHDRVLSATRSVMQLAETDAQRQMIALSSVMAAAAAAAGTIGAARGFEPTEMSTRDMLMLLVEVFGHDEKPLTRNR